MIVFFGVVLFFFIFSHSHRLCDQLMTLHPNVCAWTFSWSSLLCCQQLQLENGSSWCFTAEGYLPLSPQWARSGEVPMQSPNVHIHENLFNLFLNWLNERANVSEKNMENRIKGNLNLQFGIGSVFKSWNSSVCYMCWCYLFFFPLASFFGFRALFFICSKKPEKPNPFFSV